MAKDPAHLQSIVDIEPPTPPPAGPGIVTTVSWVALVIILAALIRVRQHSTRVRASCELRQLRKLHTNRCVDERSAAFRLAALLCRGLGTSRILPDTMPDKWTAASRDRWRGFAEKLQYARFSRDGCTARELDALIVEAAHWLGKRR